MHANYAMVATLSNQYLTLKILHEVIEQFASAFFHGWLTNLLHAMPSYAATP
jgi:hypothetical protein